ncbi:hypothetical protein HNY73_007477 [Argiope bruennichi]|uniref:Uncharacterized protein n=1 Tax=Argiope bruennichi TaxID=94029 RepID=A0A8T0FEP2_ARGBR|nr:hypothetical protein HNY73_007477 [Argiope bruennichi]
MNEFTTTYRLNTVIFGTKSSPFLAIRCLKQLASDEAKKFLLASQVPLTDVYIDDSVPGAATLEAAQELQTHLIQMLQTCGMELHKWTSNSSELINNSSEENIQQYFLVDRHTSWCGPDCLPDSKKHSSVELDEPVISDEQYLTELKSQSNISLSAVNNTSFLEDFLAINNQATLSWTPGGEIDYNSQHITKNYPQEFIHILTSEQKEVANRILKEFQAAIKKMNVPATYFVNQA